eukprot:6192686-Pleurochrysis_carterae.AAC.5
MRHKVLHPCRSCALTSGLPGLAFTTCIRSTSRPTHDGLIARGGGIKARKLQGGVCRGPFYRLSEFLYYYLPWSEQQKQRCPLVWPLFLAQSQVEHSQLVTVSPTSVFRVLASCVLLFFGYAQGKQDRRGMSRFTGAGQPRGTGCSSC